MLAILLRLFRVASRMLAVVLLMVATRSVVFSVASIGGIASAPDFAASPAATIPARLTQDSRAELALARSRGDATITLLVASHQGAAEAVARTVAAVGGAVRYRRDDVGYLRVEVPVAQADRVAQDDSVESIAVDVGRAPRALNEFFGQNPTVLPDPLNSLPREAEATTSLDAGDETADDRSREAASVSREMTSWPIDPLTHPYSPLEDLGARELLRQHPTSDGRGVTIGLLEEAVDLFMPELQVAKGLDGLRLPKVVDLRTAVDPEHDHGADDFVPTPWVRMSRDVVVRDARTIRLDSVVYAVPYAGTFRIGRFDDRRVCRQLRWTTSGYGATSRNACQFAVLWEPETERVWLDSNRDGSFADEQKLTNFAARRDVGTLGSDDPTTSRRESLSFVVQVDRARGAVAILVGHPPHASAVAATAVGSRGTHGRTDGIAPAAQLIVIDSSLSCLAAVMEGLIDAFSDPRIDVVLMEPIFTWGYRLGDGQFPMSVITARLVAIYKKPFVAPAGNVRVLNRVNEAGNIPWGFTVGAYETRESYRINRGILTRDRETGHNIMGAGGPNGVGAIKPDVIVPTGFVVAAPPFLELRGWPGMYRSKSNSRSVFGGTSQSAPTMAGSIALLISAAKLERVSYDAELIWRAITNSARAIPTLPQYRQGHGAVDIGAAFALLRAYAKHAPITIISRGPIETPYATWLSPPHQGVSLLETEGWSVGQRDERVIRLRRTTGSPTPLTFTISWRGNDGTFTTSSDVTLPRDVDVPLVITVAPKTVGIHDALLTLDHPLVPGHVHRLQFTIVAADSVGPGRLPATVELKGRLDYPQSPTHIVNVSPGAGALQMELGAGIFLQLLDPIGFQYRTAARRSVFLQPRPGRWRVDTHLVMNSTALQEVIWRTQPGQVPAPSSYAVTLTALGADIEPRLPLPLEPGNTRSTDLTVRNTLGPFNGRLVGVAIGGVRSLRLALKPREQRIFDVDVPDGSPVLFVELHGFSPTESDVDLYLFDCTTGRCLPAGAAPCLGTLPVLRKAAPRAGRWQVVVDASRIPAGGITLDYKDVVADPMWGAVAVTDGVRARPPATQWSTAASIWLTKLPPPDRLPHALVAVMADLQGVTVPIAWRAIPLEATLRTH